MRKCVRDRGGAWPQNVASRNGRPTLNCPRSGPWIPVSDEAADHIRLCADQIVAWFRGHGSAYPLAGAAVPLAFGALCQPFEGQKTHGPIRLSSAGTSVSAATSVTSAAMISPGRHRAELPRPWERGQARRSLVSSWPPRALLGAGRAVVALSGNGSLLTPQERSRRTSSSSSPSASSWASTP